MIVQLILLCTPAALGQYSGMSYGMRADMSFNDYNDRFDVEAIVKDQEQMYPQRELKNDEPVDYRRHTYLRKKDKDTSSSAEDVVNDQLLEAASTLNVLPVRHEFVPVLNMQPGINMDGKDFAYHDNMESGYETDYEKHLEPFQRRTRRSPSVLLYEMNKLLYGGQRRRSGIRTMDGVDPATEVLFRHAVPVKISIDGFVKLPQNLAN